MTLFGDVKAKRLNLVPPTTAVGFVLQWIGATFLVWVVGIFLVTLQAILGMASFFALGLMGVFSVWLMVLLAGLTLGWLSGALQSAVIDQSGKFIAGWRMATLVGGAIGVPLALFANRMLGTLGIDYVRTGEISLWLPLLVLLLSMSIAQAVTLYLQKRQAWIWVVATLLSVLAYATLHHIFWPLAVALQATIQGGALVWLLHAEIPFTFNETTVEAAHAHQ